MPTGSTWAGNDITHLRFHLMATIVLIEREHQIWEIFAIAKVELWGPGKHTHSDLQSIGGDS